MLKRLALILAKIGNMHRLSEHFLIRYEGDGFEDYDYYESTAICMRDHLLHTLRLSTVELDDEGQQVKEEMIMCLRDLDVPPKAVVEEIA